MVSDVFTFLFYLDYVNVKVKPVTCRKYTHDWSSTYQTNMLCNLKPQGVQKSLISIDNRGWNKAKNIQGSSVPLPLKLQGSSLFLSVPPRTLDFEILMVLTIIHDFLWFLAYPDAVIVLFSCLTTHALAFLLYFNILPKS